MCSQLAWVHSLNTLGIDEVKGRTLVSKHPACTQCPYRRRADLLVYIVKVFPLRVRRSFGVSGSSMMVAGGREPMFWKELWHVRGASEAHCKRSRGHDMDEGEVVVGGEWLLPF